MSDENIYHAIRSYSTRDLVDFGQSVVLGRVKERLTSALINEALISGKVTLEESERIEFGVKEVKASLAILSVDEYVKLKHYEKEYKRLTEFKKKWGMDK